MPQSPWSDLAADLLGPMPSNDYLFVVVDYYSRYFEVDILRTANTASIVESLQHMFTTHGLPNSVRTDNGPQFISKVFKDYLENNGIQHRATTPLWPQANGEVERQNRSLLKAMRTAQAENKDWKKELNTFLLAYRTTPHSTTGCTPAKLLFGRELKTKLPELVNIQTNQCARDRDSETKQRIKDYADQRRQAKASDIMVGNFVLLEQNRINKLSHRFEDEPYKVLEKDGSQLTIESSAGVRYKRNVAHVRRYVPSESGTVELDREPPPTSEQNPKRSHVIVDRADISSKENDTLQRSLRAREYRNIKCPERLKDCFVSTADPSSGTNCLYFKF